MKNITSKAPSTLAIALTIALRLTFSASAVAQSNESAKVTDVTMDERPIVGRGSPAAFGGSPVEVSPFTGTAALFIGYGSTPRVGDLAVRRQSDHNHSDQTSLKGMALFTLQSAPVNPALVKASPLAGLTSPPTGSPDSVAPDKCPHEATSLENIFIGRAAGVCIEAIYVTLTPFNGKAVSPTTVASLLGRHPAARGQSFVRATLADVTVNTKSTRRSDSISNYARIGGIVIK